MTGNSWKIKLDADASSCIPALTVGALGKAAKKPSRGYGAPSAWQELLLREISRGFGCSKSLESSIANQLL